MTFKDVKIGSCVAENDDHLQDYFVEQSGFKDLLSGEKRYVIGRKGSGKTAILKMIECKCKTSIVDYYRLTAFPFEELNSFQDKTVFRYITIWKFLVLTELAQHIINNEPTKTDKIIQLEDLLKPFLNSYTITDKIEILKSHNPEAEVEANFLGLKAKMGYSYNDESKATNYINYSQISKMIMTLLKDVDCSLEYYILFDDLDANLEGDENHKIIALVKAIEEIKTEVKMTFFRPILSIP